MEEERVSDSPLSSAASSVGERTIDALQTLGNETRLAILLALWEAIDTAPPYGASGGDALRFSELYDRVAFDDTGNFNYHLEKLVGEFVRETDAGYELSTKGTQVLQAVFAGTFADPPSFESEPSSGACFRCGAPIEIDYVDERIHLRCTDCEGVWQKEDDPTGLVAAAYRPPVSLVDLSPDEFHRHTNVWTRHRRHSILEGVCPACSGQVTVSFHQCANHEATAGSVCRNCGSAFPVQTGFVCDVCKFGWATPAYAAIFTDETVRSFFAERGLAFDEHFDRSRLKPVRDAITDVAIRGTTPWELLVRVEIDGDRLEVVLDDTASVTELRRPES